MLIRIILAAVMTAVLFFLPVEGLLALLLYLIPYFTVGYDVLLGALKNILRGRVFDEQFLMALATVGAFAIAEYPEAVAVMLFYQLGELCQDAAVGKSRRSIAALMDIRPDSATVLRDGEECVLSPEQVEVGETVIVKAGERIPLDGVILSGETAVDESALTGESILRDKGVGDRVLGGSVNVNGLIYIKVESHYRDGTVSRILEMVGNASERKARVESFITRFSRYYTPVVVISALLLAVLPPLVLHEGFAEWIYRALSFLVVSCPCALVISVPLSFFAGIGGASARGILIKGSSYLEQLSRVDTVAFDKTGTLTKGKFSVSAVVPTQGTQAELLGLAASVESCSNHPIAQCIVQSWDGEHLNVSDVYEHAGKGITACVQGETCAVGNAKLMKTLGIDPVVAHKGSIVHVAKGERYLGYLCISDTLKEDAAWSIAALKQTGVSRAVMLTGDSREVAEHFGGALALDEVHAELLPDEKVMHLETLLGNGRCVAFVGDGINDAPVLARADVGIAMGGIGSDAAIESADVVLMDDALSKLPVALRIAKQTMRIVRQNIAFALGAKLLILILAAFGIAGMWVAVFGDVGVMLLAVLNAMRTLHTAKRRSLIKEYNPM